MLRDNPAPSSNSSTAFGTDRTAVRSAIIRFHRFSANSSAISCRAAAASARDISPSWARNTHFSSSTGFMKYDMLKAFLLDSSTTGVSELRDGVRGWLLGWLGWQSLGQPTPSLETACCVLPLSCGSCWKRTLVGCRLGDARPRGIFDVWWPALGNDCIHS
jgi:hypothetical protein